jgi:replicative DNA helicase
VDWSRIARRRPPLPNDDESQRISAAIEHLTTLQLQLLDRCRLTPADVRREARMALRQFEGKLDLLIIDYLGLMMPDAPQKRRDLEIASITRALKTIASELNVPILLLSQINREPMKTESGEPELWHLRDSGAIEQDADLVIFLWESRKQDFSRELQINWKIAKQRNGPKLKLPPIQFEPEFMRFRDGGDADSKC